VLRVVPLHTAQALFCSSTAIWFQLFLFWSWILTGDQSSLLLNINPSLRRRTCIEAFLPICWRISFYEKSAKVLLELSSKPFVRLPPQLSAHKMYGSHIFGCRFRYGLSTWISSSEDLGNERHFCIKRRRTWIEKSRSKFEFLIHIYISMLSLWDASNIWNMWLWH
jgi:hypothetical protein